MKTKSLQPQDSRLPVPGSACDRRSFVKRVMAASAVLPFLPLRAGANTMPCVETPWSGNKGYLYLRKLNAYNIRVQDAATWLKEAVVQHPTNGDECRYPNRIGNYTKGLPHDSIGEVIPSAYDAYLRALTTLKPSDFEKIPLGCADGYKFVNPQAGVAYDLEGIDPAATCMPPPPPLGSPEATAEMIELYWMALTRDIPFNTWDTNPLILAACADLTRLGDAFKGPKINGAVTPQTLFRGVLPGCLEGPYNSQFRYLPVPFGANEVDQKMITVVPDKSQDFVTTFAEWLNIQLGCPASFQETLDTVKRYIRSQRDAGYWTHQDTVDQAYFMAMLTLLYPMVDSEGGTVFAPLNPGNPYLYSNNQVGFATFGSPHIGSLLPDVMDNALKAAWFHKWFVQRRLRPEEYGGLIHKTFAGIKSYPINAPALQQSPLFSPNPRFPGDELYNLVYRTWGSWLLPQVFSEGCPLHPSQPSGHATVGGACVTLLKAFFDENFVMPATPIQSNSEGTALIPYPSPVTLKLGGELNKLASNVAQSRNMAGVHYRSDALDGLLLGEQVAISLLKDQCRTYNETYRGFTFTTFSGQTITV